MQGRLLRPFQAGRGMMDSIMLCDLAIYPNIRITTLRALSSFQGSKVTESSLVAGQYERVWDITQAASPLSYFVRCYTPSVLSVS